MNLCTLICYIAITLRGQHQNLKLWYITDIPQLPYMGDILPYVANLLLIGLEIVVRNIGVSLVGSILVISFISFKVIFFITLV